MSEKKYLGIDLGTSNSAVAVFKDGKVHSLLNVVGKVNTPSVVRVLEDGVVVGQKAVRKLHSDVGNTFKEFKRLMGTGSVTEADRNGHCWSAEELSSEVLKSLKQQAENQEGCVFDKAVITVPALFELPQSKATAEAGRLAGFEKVELLPEPVASGLACGWSDNQADIAWLVYDLGGGTFDVSLLESRDGLLRVVAHDGDNFLGGRDIDRAIVEWLKEKIAAQSGITWDKSSEDFQRAMRHLEAESEKAKIRLSSVPQTIIEVEFEWEDDEVQLDVSFSLEDLRGLAEPLVQRSIDICLRLVQSQGLGLERLERVVLVGGPAHMRVVKELVAGQLAPLAEVEEDPMSLVSLGAAIFSATMGLDCEAAGDEVSGKKEYQVWLQFPSICTELGPSVMGRLIDERCKPHSVQLVNVESGWEGDVVEVDESGLFVLEASIRAGQKNSFSLVARMQDGAVLEMHHPSIDIVHGLTMSDPPLSRSIGVALANGQVKTFIDRGTPLPAKRMFSRSVVDTLVPKTGQQLVIPIVQGERSSARFCRKVGTLVIEAKDLKETLHVGSSVDITIEVDRGGDLKAQAFLPDHGKLIEGVAHLVMNHTSIQAINEGTQELSGRVAAQMQLAFRERDEKLIKQLEPLSNQLQQLQHQLQTGEDDIDTCQRLSRQLMELDAEVEHIEQLEQIAELVDEVQQSYFNARYQVEEHGDVADKRILESCVKQLDAALKNARQGELERLVERFDDIEHSARRKDPEFYLGVFRYWASYASEATNPRQAEKLIEKGNKLIDKEDYSGLKPIVHQLYNLIPERHRNSGTTSYDSGVY